jgi:hypothetical protein
LYKRPLLALCIMVTKTAEYRAKGSSKQSVTNSETSQPSRDIAEAIMQRYFRLSRKVRPGAIMYVGSQMAPGDLVDRDALDSEMRQSLRL